MELSNDQEVPESFSLNGAMIYPLRNLIASAGGRVQIEPKVMDLLCVMLVAPGRVFTRAELIEAIWSGDHGADERLTRAISQLRKAFGDTRTNPHFIETVSKRGYRLVGAGENDVGTAEESVSGMKQA